MVMVSNQESHHHQLQRVVIMSKVQTNLEMNQNNKMRNQNKKMMMNQLWKLNQKTWTMRAEPLYCTHTHTGTKTAL